MILSYMLGTDDSETLVIGLEVAEVAKLVGGDYCQVPVGELVGGEAPRLATLELVICGPAGLEIIVRAAQEAKAKGIDVRIEDSRGSST